MSSHIARTGIALALVLGIAGCESRMPPTAPTGPLPPLPAPPAGPEAPAFIGSHTLTIVAADTCDVLPPDVRTRIWEAAINGLDGGFEMVPLGGASFYPGYATASAGTRSDLFNLFLFSRDAFDLWLDDLPLYERLPEGGFVSVMGNAITSVNGLAFPLSMDLNGTIEFCAAARDQAWPFAPGCSVPIASCTSTRHRVMLARIQ